jgi:hypothetical protein
MLQENPNDRWTVDKIIKCPWMVNQDEPDSIEVSTEAGRVIELLNEKLVRLTEMKDTEEIYGDPCKVKGT